MTRAFRIQAFTLALGAAWAVVAHATVPAGTQLPLKALDREYFKIGESKKVKFLVAAPDDPNDTSVVAKLAGCTVEGDAAYNPKTARLYIKHPTLNCPSEAAAGSSLPPEIDLTGQLSDSGVDGIRLDCGKDKECTVGHLKKDADAAFTLTDGFGGAD